MNFLFIQALTVFGVSFALIGLAEFAKYRQRRREKAGRNAILMRRVELRLNRLSDEIEINNQPRTFENNPPKMHVWMDD